MNHYSVDLMFSPSHVAGLSPPLGSINSIVTLSKACNSSYFFGILHYTMIDVNVGRFIRFFHVLGAPLFTVFISIHIIRGT